MGRYFSPSLFMYIQFLKNISFIYKFLFLFLILYKTSERKMKDKNETISPSSTIEVVNYITPINKDLKTIINSKDFGNRINTAIIDIMEDCGISDIDESNYDETIERLRNVKWSRAVISELISELYADDDN